MAGRVGKNVVVNTKVKPSVKKRVAAKAAIPRAINGQPESKKRADHSTSNTAPLKKPGAAKHLHELQVRLAELERQNEDLRRAHGQLQASQHRYFDLYDIAPVGYFSISEKGIVLEVNITGANLLGGVPGDMRAQRFFNFIYEEDRDIYQQHRNKLFETLSPQACEMRMVRKDGTLVWVLVEGIVAKDVRSGKAVCLATMSDITWQKKAEETLKASEEQYRLLADHMTDTVWLMDMNLNTTYQSSSVQRVRGFTPREIEEMPLEKHMTPESLKIATDVFLEEMAKIEADQDYNFSRTLELEFYRKDGTTFWSENTFSLIRDENSRPVSILGEGRDITDRKLVEESLRASEAQYRLLSEHMTDTIRLIDMNLKTTYVSPSVEEMRGFTSLEAMELPLEKQLTPESLRVAVEILSEELPRVEADSGYNPVHTLDLEYYCKDGTTVWAESKFSVIRDENGKPVSILAEARDITERRLAEDKLAKSYESLKKTLNDAINTMVKIVELRDPYTAGHQQKVAELATAIARAMKLEDSRIDQLRMAAVTHDIGKMYVPSDILSKPGRLSNIEFSLIKTHSLSGYNIVKSMDFPCSVADAVLQHHERLDGSGYPAGLKGEDMILEAKILAVADVIEAMASHRPYRSELGIDKALEEISNNWGKLYDPDVVDACLELFNSSQFEFKSV